MKEYIEIQRVIDEIQLGLLDTCYYTNDEVESNLIERIRKIPATDMQKSVKYCPQCGAKMEGKR